MKSEQELNEEAELVAGAVCNGNYHLGVNGGREELMPVIVTMLMHNMSTVQAKKIIERIVEISLERVNV